MSILSASKPPVGNSPRPRDIPGSAASVCRRSAWAVFILFEGASDEERVPAAPGDARSMWAGMNCTRRSRKCPCLLFGLFGWTKARRSVWDDGCLQDIRHGRAPCGGMMTKNPETPAPFWLYYFNVEAVEAAMARVKDAGGQDHPRPHAGSRRQLDRPLSRPQGAIFAMVGPKG